MSGIGHLAAGFAAKPATPKAPLWVLLAAAETNDMHSNLPIFFDGSPLVGLGLENSGPGFIFMTVLDLVLLGSGIAIYLVSRKRTMLPADTGKERK